MEWLVCKLIEHIAAELPELQMVDEDYGQLEALKAQDIDTYPLTFPAVLIDAPDVQWNNISEGSQKGICRFRVRLVVDCYDDTHAGSGTTYKVQERAEMKHRLHRVLCQFRPDADGGLTRESSRDYTWGYGIKVYETTYSCVVTDTIPERETIVRPTVKIALANRT